MATKIEAGTEPVKRQEFFTCDPNGVVLDPSLNGRYKPISEEAVVEMAESLLVHGQRTPIECRKIAGGNTIIVTYGYTRLLAARLLRAGFTSTLEGPFKGEFKQDAEFVIKVMMSAVNEKDAFIHNIVENAHRNGTSDIDDAHNQNRLRDTYGYNDVEIGALYRYKTSVKVGRLKKLLALPESIQDLVHVGKMTTQAALDLLEVPADRWTEVVEDATDEAGKVSSAVIRSAARDSQLAGQDDTEVGSALADEELPFDAVEGGSEVGTVEAGIDSNNTDGSEGTELPLNGATVETAETGKPPRKPAPQAGITNAKGRSMKEFKAWLESQDGPGSSPDCRKYVEVTLEWPAGKKTDKQLQNAFNKLNIMPESEAA